MQGYHGKPKGLKQVLWERGLWKEGMIKTVDPDKDKQGRGHDLSMVHVLENCYDFATERTAFQHMMIERGHIPEMSPKCHPELAGVGIEYSWGKSKQWFRRHSDHVARNLHENIKESFKLLNLPRVRKFARKTRSYGRAYDGRDSMQHGDIEKNVHRMKKLRQKKKSHRGADRQDLAFLNNN